MYCEICGRRTQGKMSLVAVKGATLRVCAKCSEGRMKIRVQAASSSTGTVKPQVIRRAPLPSPEHKASPPKEEIELSLRPKQGYGQAIHKARGGKGLTVEDFARLVGIRESLVRKIEAEKITPSIPDLRKVERTLGVRLVEEDSDDIEAHIPKAKSPITLGEVAKLRRSNQYDET